MLKFILGVIVGCSILGLLLYFSAIGDLRIDRSDPEDMPNLFLELKAPERLFHSKFVILKVVEENLLSQN